MRIGFIVPYFGKLPETFRLWIECCKNNPSITWFVFTDDQSEFAYPRNIVVEYTTLKKMRENFERKLGFNVALQQAYKLCDFKPLYGFLFSEYLKDFSHWGYCDIDLLFGDLKKYFDENSLLEFQKINILGHMSVYKNTESVNCVYTRCDYRKILQDPRIRTFDEVRFEPNINTVMKNAGMHVSNTIPYADIGADHFNFHLHEYRQGNRTSVCKYNPTIFRYDGGRLFQCSVINGNAIEKEIAYVHFQKRRVICNSSDCNNYLLVPNRVIESKCAEKSLILKCSKDNYVYFFKHFGMRIKRALKSRLHA